MIRNHVIKNHVMVLVYNCTVSVLSFTNLQLLYKCPLAFRSSRFAQDRSGPVKVKWLKGCPQDARKAMQTPAMAYYLLLPRWAGKDTVFPEKRIVHYCINV